VVLDLNLPRIDGLDVCRTIRRESDTPVIMLTAKTEEQAMATGIRTGANQYLTSPSSPSVCSERWPRNFRRPKARSAPQMPDSATLSGRVLEALISAGLVTAEQVRVSEASAADTGANPGEVLVQRGLVIAAVRPVRRAHLLEQRSAALHDIRDSKSATS
jgi:DNA-binding response OmpR family regulator